LVAPVLAGTPFDWKSCTEDAWKARLALAAAGKAEADMAPALSAVDAADTAALVSAGHPPAARILWALAR